MSNFSSYVRLDLGWFKGLLKLKLVEKSHLHGYWEIDPPETVVYPNLAYFQLKDHAGPTGTHGTVVYESDDAAKTRFTLEFACPYKGDNFAKATSSGTDAEKYGWYAGWDSDCTPDKPHNWENGGGSGECYESPGIYAEQAKSGHPIMVYFLPAALGTTPEMFEQYKRARMPRKQGG